MSTDEENDALPQEDHSTTAEAAPKKRATKKAAKKATKKRAIPRSAVAKDLSDTGSDTFTPGEIAPAKAESDLKLSPSSNGDDEVTFSADIKVDQVEEKDLGDHPEQPREPKVGHGNGGKGHKPNHNNGSKNQNQNQHPNDRQKGNGKFNKNNRNNNKRKRGKNNRWDKNKVKREREEETPIEFGELQIGRASCRERV